MWSLSMKPHRTVGVALVTLAILVGVGARGKTATSQRTTHPSGRETARPTTPATEDAKARWVKIVTAAEKVTPGITKEQIAKLLGQPDHVRPLYEPKVKNPRQIGTTWFYMQDPTKNPHDEGPKIGVRLDLKNKVTRVDKLGTWKTNR